MAPRQSKSKSARRSNNRNGRFTRVPREPHNLGSLATYRIRRTVDAGQQGIAPADQGAARFFTPGAITSWSDFSNLYDMYRVTKITYRYVCWRAAQPATTGESFPTFFYALDFNDTVAPATAQEVLDYGNAQIHTFAEGDSRVIEVTYVPKLQMQTAASTAVLPMEAGWARTSTTTDTWLGHKEWFRNYNTTTYNNTVVSVYAIVDLEFKVTK